VQNICRNKSLRDTGRRKTFVSVTSPMDVTVQMPLLVRERCRLAASDVALWKHSANSRSKL